MFYTALFLELLADVEIASVGYLGLFDVLLELDLNLACLLEKNSLLVLAGCFKGA